MEQRGNKRDELINIAGEFFFTKGFSKTSVQNIIDKADIAKGTFYHYFKSKDEILDAMARNFVKGMYKDAYKLVEQDFGAVEKLNKLFEMIQSIKAGNIKLMKVLTKVVMSDNNLVLRHRILRITVEVIAPLYEKIIIQGNEEGVFDVEFPKLTSEFFISSFVYNGEQMSKLFIEENFTEEIAQGIRDQVTFYERTIERILGCEKGCLNTISDETLEYIVRGLMAG